MAHLVAALAARVRVPVMHTVAEHERWWDTSPDVLDRFRALFIASPRVEIDVQVAAGHNLSLGRSARAHHLRVLAFATECLLPTLPPPVDHSPCRPPSTMSILFT